MRGTASLPLDLEDRFRRAYGREMSPEERKFFGLDLRGQEPKQSAEREQARDAA